MPQVAAKEKRREFAFAALGPLDTLFYGSEILNNQVKDTVARSYVPLPIFPSGKMPWAAIHSKDSS